MASLCTFLFISLWNPPLADLPVSQSSILTLIHSRHNGLYLCNFFDTSSDLVVVWHCLWLSVWQQALILFHGALVCPKLGFEASSTTCVVPEHEGMPLIRMQRLKEQVPNWIIKENPPANKTDTTLTPTKSRHGDTYCLMNTFGSEDDIGNVTVNAYISLSHPHWQYTLLLRHHIGCRGNFQSQFRADQRVHCWRVWMLVQSLDYLALVTTAKSAKSSHGVTLGQTPLWGPVQRLAAPPLLPG